MADIELVIKIPEEIRLALINNTYLSKNEYSVYDAYMQHAIIDGIPLPKGHGRLIDADELENVCHEEFLKGMSISAGMVNVFNDAQTIIPADKEKEE